MIVTNTVDEVEIPHEPGNKIGIRQLSGLEMDEASAIASQRSLKNYANMKEAYDAIRDGTTTSVATTETDPMLEYDHAYILKKAIVLWNGPNYNTIDCNDDNKLQLDPTTKKWLIELIIHRNHVPLVLSKTSETSMNEGTF